MSRPGFVWLASQSPRRRQLLEQIGVRHELLLPQAHEDAEALEAEVEGELPADYCERVTRAKLQAARARLAALKRESAPILCSDTTVALGRCILGKPRDAAHAIETLTALAGRTHRVITAVAVASGRREWLAVSSSRVHFAAMPPHASPPATSERADPSAAVLYAQACASCHGDDAGGTAEGPPLNAQPAFYLAQQLQDWQKSRRRNDGRHAMLKVAQRLGAEDLRHLSLHLARIPPRPAAPAR